MYSATNRLMFSLRRKGPKNMQGMLESHFWSLTRYRIFPRLLALDHAGNVIFYPAYRKQTFGGWSAVTMASTPGSGLLTSDTTGVNVLEDGYPMHYKASKKLQAFVAEERRRWQAKEVANAEARKKAAAAATAGADAAKPAGAAAAGGVSAKDASAAAGLDVDADFPSSYDPDARFRDMLAIKCSNPRFYSQKLRISSLTTLLYKLFYFYLWGVLISLIIQGYFLFRSWVNPPAREGLKNLEEHVLHLPRLLFASLVYGLAALVRATQPVLDPILSQMMEWFPQVNWQAASAENLANRAKHLADDTHPSAEKRKAEEKKVQVQTEMERKSWWTKVLMTLLALFAMLCVL